jgi:hypothetical protein
MITTQKMMELLTGRESIDAFIEGLIAQFPELSEDHQRFQEAIACIKNNLGDEAKPSVEELIGAMQRQIVSNWLFSSYLGFQANLEHFQNPVARTFIEVDPETYLRESVARTLPEYTAAQAIMDCLLRQLPVELETEYETVIAYIAHLETVVPKMAHYQGFLLGNEFLPRVIPGYQPDVQLTVRYCAMIEEYF